MPLSCILRRWSSKPLGPRRPPTDGREQRTHASVAGAHLSIMVQGTTVPIGMLMKEIDSAKVHSWTEADDGTPPGTSTLVLVPAETNTLTMFLDDRARP